MIKDSDFIPAWWLPGAHLQTIWPTLARKKIELQTDRTRITLPDGDFIDLDWVGDKSGPTVLILHGLGGSLDSLYAQGLLKAVAETGWTGVFMNFRGCSGEPNRLPRSYHSGDTKDLDYVIDHIRSVTQNAPAAAVGYSMGGNILLKWLGETERVNPLRTAVAISVPFELENAANTVNRGTSKIYQWWLLRSVRKPLIAKFSKMKSKISVSDLVHCGSFWEFDNLYTAPFHGFKNAEDYYRKSSSKPYLRNIDIPTLILHAKNDPFMANHVIPTEKDLSEQVTLEISTSGGHVGFVSGKTPWKANYWLEKRIIQHLKLYF